MPEEATHFEMPRAGPGESGAINGTGTWWWEVGNGTPKGVCEEEDGIIAVTVRRANEHFSSPKPTPLGHPRTVAARKVDRIGLHLPTRVPMWSHRGPASHLPNYPNGGGCPAIPWPSFRVVSSNCATVAGFTVGVLSGTDGGLTQCLAILSAMQAAPCNPELPCPYGNSRQTQQVALMTTAHKLLNSSFSRYGYHDIAPADEGTIRPHPTGMELSGTDGGEDSDRRRGAPLSIMSPAGKGTARPHPAEMNISGTDSGEGSDRRRGYITPTGEGAIRPHSASVGASGTDRDKRPARWRGPPAIEITPAGEGAVRPYPTSVGASGTDRNERLARRRASMAISAIDRGEHPARRRGYITPTGEGAIRPHSASVGASGTDRDKRPARWRGPPAIEITPAGEGAVRPYPTSVGASGTDRNERLARRRGLPVTVTAPAGEGTVRPYSAGMVGPRTDRDEGSARRRGLSIRVATPAGENAVRPHSTGVGFMVASSGADGGEGDVGHGKLCNRSGRGLDYRGSVTRNHEHLPNTESCRTGNAVNSHQKACRYPIPPCDAEEVFARGNSVCGCVRRPGGSRHRYRSLYRAQCFGRNAKLLANAYLIDIGNVVGGDKRLHGYPLPPRNGQQVLPSLDHVRNGASGPVGRSVGTAGNAKDLANMDVMLGGQPIQGNNRADGGAVVRGDRRQRVACANHVLVLTLSLQSPGRHQYHRQPKN